MDNNLVASEPKASFSPALDSEYVFQDSKLKVKGNRIIGARLVGKAGVNRYRRDFPEALQRQSLPLMDGVKVNIDHINLEHNKFRGFKDRLGWVEKPRMRDGETYGDLVINPKHPWAETLLWWAENRPDMVGVSMDFIHDWSETADGRRLVTKISKIEGFDIVADPSNTRGLEAKDAVPPEKKGRKVKPKKGKQKPPANKGSPNDPVDPTPPDKKPPQPPIDNTAASVSAGNNPQANDPDGDGIQDEAPDDLPEFDPIGYEGDDYEEKLGELVKSIICDEYLTPEEKSKKILIALKLLSDDNAGEKQTEDEEETLDEEDEDMANVQGLEAVSKERDTFKAEVETLREKVRAFEAKEARSSALADAAKTCTERGLESVYQDDYLLEILISKSKEDQFKIIDREKAKIKTSRGQEAVEKTVPTVTSTERQPVPNVQQKELPPVSDLLKAANLN